MNNSLPKLSSPSTTTKDIKSVCVYCGSNVGASPEYEQEARKLGKVLADNNLRLVYGGGSVGLMGAVAQETLANGGNALGVVPEPLYRHGSKQICEVTIVPDMHTRKKKMADESDAFIVLPGGYGTMEEMLEMITWSQLNVHAKPIILLNTNNYFQLFVDWIKHSIQENFVNPNNAGIFVVCDSASDIMDALNSYRAPDSRYGLDWTRQELMGVHGLTGLIKRFAPNAVQTVSCTAFSNKSLAIDASCHLNKFIYGDERHPHRHIYGFYLLARFCDLNQINPIFIFDGAKRLEAKQLEHAKRARQRRKVKHSLLFEKEQSNRLNNWLEMSSLYAHKAVMSRKSAINILNELGETLQNLEDTSFIEPIEVTKSDEKHQEIEAKLFQIAQELRHAIEIVEDTDRYTKTVRELANREKDLISEMIANRFQHTKTALQKLKNDNQAMLASLEKRSYRITQQTREECQEFLTTLGYTCFSCENHEAEAMCAHLSKAGRTSAIVSEDMDTLVFGDVPILRYFFSRGRPILSIDPVIARQQMGLSREAFVDLCILCGTDFSGTIKGIGPHRAFKAIKTYGSIEKLLKKIDSKYIPQDTFNYQLARQVFNSLPPIPLNDSDYKRPLTSDTIIQNILRHYEINSIDASIKLHTSLLQQKITDSQTWGIDPFNQNNSFTTSYNRVLNF